MRAAPMVLFVLAACSKPYVPPDETDDTDVVDTDTDTEPDTDTDTDSDTDLPETDADGDGWSVEDGDCNDDDIWVNPAWNEREEDDKDNDCDGRVDEVFTGVRVFEYDEPKSHIHFISSFGELDPRGTKVDLPGAYGFSVMVDSIDGDGWVLLNGGGVVVHVEDTGGMSILWDDSETEYEEGQEPLWYIDLEVHPDGYYIVNGGDRVWRIDPDGSSTMLEQWDCVEDPDGATDICSTGSVLDPTTGLLGLLGYFGGFSTWTNETGLQAKVVDDPEAEVPPYLYSKASSVDGGGFYMYGSSVDVTIPEIKDTGFFRWNDEKNEWIYKTAWGNGGSSDYTIADFTIEDETGDFYVSTNGGWERALWRVTADGKTTADLYRSAQDRPEPDFGPVLIEWKQD